jgi:polyphosphate kinase 2
VSDKNKKSKSKFILPPAEDGFPGVDVVIDGVHVDLDADELPEAIKDKALSSGGFPYKKKLKGDDYDATLETLQIELLKLQAHVNATGAKIVILFEGRDSAGKGGTIARFTEHLNPRSAHVVALSKPTDTERGQFYFQRYIAHLPTAGEITLFDRSWYNRAVVEPVMGFCKPEETTQFLKDVPVFEKMLVENGIHLVKFWLTIGREMQIKRLFERRHDPLKRWKLSAIDYKGLPLWDDYTAAAEKMLKATHTKDAPWTILRSNDQKRGRIEAIRVVLSGIDYAGRDEKAAGTPDPKIVLDAATFRSRDGQI